MKLNIFKYNTYIEVIEEVLSLHPERGFKSKLASGAGCQLSFLSQALNKSVKLTEDHIFGISRFLNLNENEREYFQLLLRREKASSKRFKLHLGEEIKTIKRSSKVLANRISPEESNLVQKEKYYSTWYYSAIHVALSIPSIKSYTDLESLLGVKQAAIEKTIEDLCAMGLVEPTRNFYKTIQYDLHVKANSPLFKNYNMVWRTYLLHKMQDLDEDNLHYTAVHSISAKDYDNIREKMIEWIQDSRKTVEESPEEELIVIALDMIRF